MRLDQRHSEDDPDHWAGRASIGRPGPGRFRAYISRISELPIILPENPSVERQSHIHALKYVGISPGNPTNDQ
jgi:hypothetical protein